MGSSTMPHVPQPSLSDAFKELDMAKLLTTHTIIYNRTYNEPYVLAVYKPVAMVFSPGNYVSFSTASNDEIMLTPTTVFLNNMGFPVANISRPAQEGYITLSTVTEDQPGSNDICVGVCVPIHIKF